MIAARSWPFDEPPQTIAIRAIPHLFLIGRDGRIVANHLGYGPGSLQQLVDDINAAFRETPTAAPVTVPAPAAAPAHQH
jgi:hypothetical protein